MTAIGGGIVGGLVAMVAPSILSGVLGVIRPVAKEILKGGIVVCTAVSDMVANVGGQCGDLVSEAKTEVQGEESKPTPPKQGSPG